MQALCVDKNEAGKRQCYASNGGPERKSVKVPSPGSDECPCCLGQI